MADLYASIGVDATKFEYQVVGKLLRRRSPWAAASSTFDHPTAFISARTSGQSPACGSSIHWTKKLEGAPMPAAMRAEILKYRQIGCAQSPGQAHPRRNWMPSPWNNT